MASKTLSQINKELGSIYDPYYKNIQQRKSLIPEAIKSEEAALGARQEQAFGEILGGARRRGLGFSGIPLSEQAKYTSTEYLPALARLRQSGREQEMSLEEALLGLNRDRRTQAQSIFEANRNYDLANRQHQESIRQFNEQMRAAAQERARAAAASAASFTPSFGGTGGGATAGAATDPNKQKAVADVQQLLGRRGSADFYREIMAINKSASYGNAYDRAKLQLLQVAQPGLFQKGKLNTTRINSLISHYSKSAGSGGW